MYRRSQRLARCEQQPIYLSYDRFAIAVALTGNGPSSSANIVEEIGAQLWTSANTDGAYDVLIGETRYVANPTGFPGKVIEVEGLRPNRVNEVTPCSDCGAL